MLDFKDIIYVSASLAALIGAIYAFFRWGLLLIRKLFTPLEQITYKIPKKTIIIIPLPREKSSWWHMGSSSGKPAMQVVGHFKVTNITKYNILLTAAKMRKPKLLGHILVKDTESQYHGSYPIPGGATTDMTIDFWIMPPVREKGATFITDIAILDQFANEHWIKKVEFEYS
jgi:hypothetical protein